MIKHTAETPITEFWKCGPRTASDMQKEINELRECLKYFFNLPASAEDVWVGEHFPMQVKAKKLLDRK